MSDRPTPETDSAIIERRYIHKVDGSVKLFELVEAELSRKLERERDQALEDLEVLRSNKMGDPLLEITFRNLISERDELKYKIKELDQALKASAELLCFFFQQSGITKEDLKERLEAAK